MRSLTSQYPSLHGDSASIVLLYDFITPFPHALLQFFSGASLLFNVQTLALNFRSEVFSHEIQKQAVSGESCPSLQKQKDWEQVSIILSKYSTRSILAMICNDNMEINIGLNLFCSQGISKKGTRAFDARLIKLLFLRLSLQRLWASSFL